MGTMSHFLHRANSRTSAKLVECVPQGLRLAGIRDGTASLLTMLDRVHRLADCFDVIHFHLDLLQFPLFRDVAHKCVTTLHGRQDLPDFHPIYRAFPEMQLVSISDNQREPAPSSANWVATVHHGAPESSLELRDGNGGYLAFLGRISPEKRPDRAIEIAQRAGVPLKIAAKVDNEDRGYFDQSIRSRLSDPLVEFVGEIDDAQKAEFLGKAMALLFPIDWPEPFGLVMIESMAVGTPIIAWPAGSVREIIDPGITGIVVDSIDAAVDAVRKVRTMNREAVRSRFAERFTSRRMARDYITVYDRLLKSHLTHTMERTQRLLNGKGIEIMPAQADGLLPSPAAFASVVDAVVTRPE